MPTINEILQRYSDAIDSGFGLIQGDVSWLFNVLVVLNVVLAAFIWAFSDDQVIVQLARKVIYIGFFAWIVQNWHSLTTVLADTFIQLGLRAGGGEVPDDILRNPGAIAGQSLTVTAPIQDYIYSLSGPIETFFNFVYIMILTIAVLAIIVSYLVIAIQLVIAILAFKIGTLLAFILIPFSLIKHTSFMAERPLGWVVASAVRLMALTLVVGIGQSVMGTLQLDAETMSIAKALDVTFGAVVLMILSLLASRLAGDVVSGAPRLGASDVALAAGGVAAASNYAVGKASSMMTRPFRGKQSGESPAAAASKVPGQQAGSAANLNKD